MNGEVWRLYLGYRPQAVAQQGRAALREEGNPPLLVLSENIPGWRRDSESGMLWSAQAVEEIGAHSGPHFPASQLVVYEELQDIKIIQVFP